MKSLLIAALVAATPLPPLQPELLHAAISDLQNPVATSAQLRVAGDAGRWYGTAGLADGRREVRPGDRFRIGSVSKVFVATVALQLVQERRLSLDTKVRHYFPDVPETLDAVTVGQLLNHTSGIPNEVGYPDLSTPAKVLAHRYDSWTAQQLRDLIPETQPKFTPGTKQEYRGINYLLATMIVEKVTGRDLSVEVRDRVTRPLGLDRTYVPQRNETTLLGAHVHGYLDVDGQRVDVSDFNTSRAHGEGDMVSTTSDLTRFMKALVDGKLVRQPLLEKMFTLPDVSMVDGRPAAYATGLQTFTVNGVEVWGKTGEWYGYNAGMFSTRDGQRRIAYSFTPTVRDANQQQMTLRIANAVTAGDQP
ncbi:serine hydrolase domain-containing protein [Lentzea sp. NPDC058450]|uniref:serine hydrolase domain-containing protein n=1 Tax=Lentzea sp. NPDC058450 TaxID=3346505 RepID=UPI00365C4EF4